MEPMILGSPTSSPNFSSPLNISSINIPTTSTTASYYPSYLLGESQQNTTMLSQGGRIPLGSTSPSRPSRGFSTTTALPSPGSPQPSRENFFTNRIGSERQAGPPTMSLAGGLPLSPSLRVPARTFVEQQKIIGGPSLSTPSSSTLFSSPIGSSHSLMPVTPTASTVGTSLVEVHNESQVYDFLEEPWITVFGFPPSSSSYILTQFAQLGTIIDQRQPGSGNWMHIKYQTKLQARKALSKNGKIFDGKIMIGVTPCTDKKIIGDKENLTLDSSAIFSPRDTSLPTTPKANIRPLTQAYQASRADIEVLPSSNTPKKNESLVSKALQHILGV